jgi:hypothetical protein
VTAFFKAFEVEDPWTKLGKIAVDIGASRVSLLQDYKNLATTRHNSAHDPASNVPTADLQAHIEVAIVIAIVVDVLATAIGNTFKKGIKPGALKTALNGLTHRYRFLDEQNTGHWVELSPSGRAIKRYPTEAAAKVGVAMRVTPAYVICRNARKSPVELC